MTSGWISLARSPASSEIIGVLVIPPGTSDRVGRWLDERIDLARVYAEIWKDAAPAHLVDVAVFCDSDDTHTASISYFAYVRLERR
jgi:hypothetical protein